MKKQKRRLKRAYFTVILVIIFLCVVKAPQSTYAATNVLPAPANVKAVTVTYNSVNISWSGVSGAAGYRLYRSTSSSGSYTLIKTTSSKSFKDTGLTTDKTYYYKLRAYQTVKGSKVFGSCTTVVKAKPILALPASIHAIASPEGVISVIWNTSKDADGYEIYKAAAIDGIYNLLSTATATSYNDTGLKAGTTSYYKVRSYKNIAGKKVYSGFTDIVSGMIPIINVTAVTLNKSTDTLIMGETGLLTAAITPANATNQKVTWKSSDTGIATVDKKGNITSVSPGTTLISVTTADGSFSAQCYVTVVEAQLAGIDVSKWQKSIQWDLVKNSGIEFAMIRSSYGSSSIDPMFETNYQGAKSNGIAVGVYHYSYATTVKKAAAEVTFLINTLKGKQLEYPVCVDMEDSSMNTLDRATLTDIALTYLNGLKNAGFYPIIYSNKTWFTTKLDDSKLTDYDHWLAQWGTSYDYAGEVGIWQYSSTGKVDGISTSVDLDTSFVNYAAMIKRLRLNGF